MDKEKPPLFDQIIALPTWSINNLVFPFLPKDHLWKKLGGTPSLDMWTIYRTPLTTLFDTAFWICIIGLCVLLMSIYFKSIV